MVQQQKLKSKIDQLAARLRQARRWRKLAWCWFVAALMGAVYGWLEPGILSTVQLSIVISASILTAFVFAWWHPRSTALHVARLIEQHFPELNDRLLTSLERTETEGELNLLERQLLNETWEHALEHDWLQIVPRKQLWRAALWQTCCLASFTMVVYWLIQHGPEASTPLQAATIAEPPSKKSDLKYGLNLEPGNVEIERGTPLLVLAKFANALPAEVTFVLQLEQEPVQRISMTKSLDDPVFGTRIPQVNTSGSYYVEYDGRRSAKYYITTFEYPETATCRCHRETPGVYPETGTHIGRRATNFAAGGFRTDTALHNESTCVCCRIANGNRPEDDSHA